MAMTPTRKPYLVLICTSITFAARAAKAFSQMRIILEKGPKHTRHCESDSLVGRIRQCSVSLAEPLDSRAVTTSRARARFARVVHNELLLRTSVNLRSQFSSLALHSLAKDPANYGQGVIVVPVWTSLRQNLLEWMVVFHAVSTPFGNIFRLIDLARQEQPCV